MGKVLEPIAIPTTIMEHICIQSNMCNGSIFKIIKTTYFNHGITAKIRCSNSYNIISSLIYTRWTSTNYKLTTKKLMGSNNNPRRIEGHKEKDKNVRSIMTNTCNHKIYKRSNVTLFTFP